MTDVQKAGEVECLNELEVPGPSGSWGARLVGQHKFMASPNPSSPPYIKLPNIPS